MTGEDIARWQRPVHSKLTRMEILQKRHIIKRAIRDYFHKESFIEIDMPLLVRGTSPDAAIDSFSVNDRYLTSSTEYQIKRMETGGFERLYTLTQNFRRGDGGPYRNPEFTMLEWARAGGTLKNIEEDAEKSILNAHHALGGKETLDYCGHTIDLSPPWDRISICEAVQQHTGVNLPDFTAESFASALEQTGIPVKDDWRKDTAFLFTVLLDHIQKNLGLHKPVFLQEWPSFLTSSAQTHESGTFTERSELFIAGIEISDGFPSLTDAAQQQQNFTAQMERRTESDMAPVALDEKYIAALEEGLPAGAGMALGLDRLVVVLTGCKDIKDVLAFNWDEL